MSILGGSHYKGYGRTWALIVGIIFGVAEAVASLTEGASVTLVIGLGIIAFAFILYFIRRPARWEP